MSGVDTRKIGWLTAPETPSTLNSGSVLCLPIGSYEQHGPHLPLSTDTVIAERFTNKIVDSYGDQFDMWALPAIPYGLAREHSWAPGTIAMPINIFTTMLDAVCAQYVRATPARNLLIVNGHGGNRGILEAAIYELADRHGVNACVVHPSSLSTVRADGSLPEIHAGLRETSVMLALAPEHVHLERLPPSYQEETAQEEAIRRTVLHRGTTWPWSSGDPAISTLGIMGSDARQANHELGEKIMASAVDACADVIGRLRSTRP